MRTALGIIGYPLNVTFSPAWFARKFADEGLDHWTYEVFPLTDISALPALLAERSDLLGLNVTIPYKKEVIPYLDELDPVATRIGAVNTIRIMEDGQLIGYNTDGPAFLESLAAMLGPGWQGRALILGSGGAAQAVQDALVQLEIPFDVTSRQTSTDTLTYQMIQERGLGVYRLIINTTPMGMSPHLDEYPDIPFRELGPDYYLYDLIYTPEETHFLKEGRKQGATGQNGLEMLYLQAEKSWQIWTTK